MAQEASLGVDGICTDGYKLPYVFTTIDDVASYCQV